MELQYIKAMKDNNLSHDALPDDAQVGIGQIKEIQRAISMLAKVGKTPTEKAIKKLKALDKWVYYEILDFLQDTDKNSNEMPGADEVIDELNKDINKGDNNQRSDATNSNLELKGLKIDEELEVLITLKPSWTMDELETSAPTTYNVLFDGYEPGDDNGIETSKFTLIESEDYNFILTTRK